MPSRDRKMRKTDAAKFRIIQSISSPKVNPLNNGWLSKEPEEHRATFF
jgi:hypothetical protein